VIELAKSRLIARRVQLENLSRFIGNRFNRIDSIVNLIKAEEDDEDIGIEYSAFKSMLEGIHYISEEFETLNGMIHYTIYGDVKHVDLVKRERNELYYTYSKLLVYIDEMSEMEEKLDALKETVDSILESRSGST